MPNFAILRVQKLKSAIAVRRSFKHAFREQDTPNADPERTPDNTHLGPQNVDQAMDAFRSRLPEKHRVDAVLAIEYLVTATPEAMRTKGRDGQNAYFLDALKWLQTRHGKENVVYAGVHRDEASPHMYAYVVPRVGERLNCRHFLGGAKALSEMQTSFAEEVGAKHDLERGLEGSRARHTTLKQYYGRVHGKTPPTANIDVPSPSISDRLNPREYGHKVAKSVLEQIKPTWEVLQAKAKESDLAKQQAKEARDTLEDQDRRLRPLLEAMRSLNREDQLRLAQVTVEAGKKLATTRQRERQEKIRQEQERKLERQSRGPDLSQ
ncbi:MAG: hypothetical protein EOO38_04630 [Cytophagaceae bacterium]|nr:MAG: hypothetical protein EOO38_04630 [Cytophagaceae bacterium]